MAKAKSAGISRVTVKGHPRQIKDKYGNPKTVNVSGSARRKPRKTR